MDEGPGFEKINIREVELMVKELRIGKLVHEEILRHLPFGEASISTFWKNEFGGMAAELSLKLLGQRLEVFDVEIPVSLEFRYQIPLSWWQHFKMDNFPKWLLEKFPVQYYTHREFKKVVARDKFHIDVVYPDLEYLIPKDGRAVLMIGGEENIERIFDCLVQTIKG